MASPFSLCNYNEPYVQQLREESQTEHRVERIHTHRDYDEMETEQRRHSLTVGFLIFSLYNHI